MMTTMKNKFCSPLIIDDNLFTTHSSNFYQSLNAHFFLILKYGQCPYTNTILKKEQPRQLNAKNFFN